MNKTLTWATAIALAMATLAATPALARDDRGRHGHSHRDHDRHDRRHDRRDSRWDRRDDRRRDYAHHRDRRHDQRYDRRPVVVRHVYHPPRHAGPPRWARGGHVHSYNRPVYVVQDYRGYGLRHPPRGHRWVRDDYGDYLLVAITTGLIVDLILRN
ncbi:MAG: RcnB family protein [Luteimonas sp.]|nr:RcnB family protein [Luteimonas sp.]